MQVYRAWPTSFKSTREVMIRDLLDTEPITVGEWQSMDTGASPLHQTWELEDVTWYLRLPSVDTEDEPSVAFLDRMFEPDQPWASKHFAERVSGTPLNPPPSHVDWPYTVRSNDDHTSDGKFDHTYPERFWPKWAPLDSSGYPQPIDDQNKGIRFEYGDLLDVVDLLVKRPGTRQAYLPVWFPEDTGGHVRINARVPCTLGYHFMIRDNQLSTRYYIRSCDVYRHFTNDVYLAARLALWMADHVNSKRSPSDPIYLSTLSVHIGSLHAFKGDVGRLWEMVR